MARKMKRLTNRNYKNTTLDLESCKPYLKLGEIEDLEDKFNVDVNEELFKKAKAFDIIKEKMVDIWNIKATFTVEQYNRIITKYDGCEVFNLIKEEYGLLKEVLKNE